MGRIAPRERGVGGAAMTLLLFILAFLGGEVCAGLLWRGRTVWGWSEALLTWALFCGVRSYQKLRERGQ